DFQHVRHGGVALLVAPLSFHPALRTCSTAPNICSTAPMWARRRETARIPANGYANPTAGTIRISVDNEKTAQRTGALHRCAAVDGRRRRLADVDRNDLGGC